MNRDELTKELMKNCGYIEKEESLNVFRVVDFILAREAKMLDALIGYVEHEPRCLHSQFRQGEQTEKGYRRLYGHGNQEKWYYGDDMPECSCGLSDTINRLREAISILRTGNDLR